MRVVIISSIVEDVFTGCSIDNEVAVASTIDPPAASAGDDSPVSCENLQLTLGGTGDTLYTVSWNTVNGHIVSGGNTYTPVVDAPGDYSMTVINPSNSCSTTDAMVVINNLQPAQSLYSYQTSGLTMLGNDQSSGSNVSGWAWTFGDGGSSNDPNTVHTFAAPGTYDVCLTVQNGCGVNQSCQQVTVSFVGSVLSVDPVITNVTCLATLLVK
jgi:PKD repeat protein